MDYTPERITPACAGKSFPSRGCWGRGWDHPRLCGEKSKLRGLRDVPEGSPPPVRGKDRRLLGPAVHSRITPACAGKRRCVFSFRQGRADHPRLCGEKMVEFWFTFGSMGSPPPVRGKARQTCRARGRARITPACAGKRSPHPTISCVDQDHPRLCGEKGRFGDSWCRHWGSPPPVRGKVYNELILGLSRRITPACAGKRKSFQSYSLPVKDHPRLCGEKSTHFASRTTVNGSPPPVRGKGRSGEKSKPLQRITPACAGKSVMDVLDELMDTDHPRLCGEKVSGCIARSLPVGSPPPVRGKASSPDARSTQMRITPACAGKS